MINRPPISAAERCIVALDVPDTQTALTLVDQLDGLGCFYKIGLELFAGGHGKPLIDTLVRRGLNIFADLKLFDVPETVGRATAQLADSGVHFLTVHGNDAIMEAAVKNKGDNLHILAVTALTSLDEADMRDLGFNCSLSELVLSRAKRAGELGCAGVVSSGKEVAALRQQAQHHNQALTLVTPGVRPGGQSGNDDQKRIAAPGDIIRNGGDYLVVGRPIKNAPDPKAAMQAIVDEINDAL